MKTKKEKKTSKQKLDELLGIPDNSSVDDFLNSMTLELDEAEENISHIDEKVKSNIKTIDDNISNIKLNGIENSSLSIQNIDNSLQEIEELIGYSKKIFKHVYESLVSSDLVDSELVGAAAKLLESIHVNISEFLSLYKEREQFANKIKVMVFQQDQKKELLELKHKYDMEKLQSTKVDNSVQVENLTTYSQEQIVKMLSENPDLI